MKYPRCAKCELNFVEKEGDICEICLNLDSLDDEDEDFGVCAVCGEERLTKKDEYICKSCRLALSGDYPDTDIDSKVMDNFF